MKHDLTHGNVTKTMINFALPMILGNLLQQFYNIADTVIAGKFIGSDALASVGSAYSLMTFLTSVIIGLCMGSGTVFSICFGRNDRNRLKNSIAVSFLFIATVTIIINTAVFMKTDLILHMMKIPADIYYLMRKYVRIISSGIFFVFLYNYFSFLSRALGNSAVPLCFLGISSVLNIILDILFIVVFKTGISGAGYATVTAQALSGIGIGIYVFIKEKNIFPKINDIKINRINFLEVIRHSFS
ncbi:MAG: MATE family efflux transporter, partial [Ruminococcus sp.]